MTPEQPTISLPQLCYDVAYFVLPHYAHNALDRLSEMCLNSPAMTGPFFYVMACQMREVEPVVEDARLFSWQHGHLDGAEYFLLEYPEPPPVDFSGMSLEEIGRPAVPLVLAPHFSLIIRQPGAEASYFILGQAPMGGGTTLRCVTRDGANCNLGPGPVPQVKAFLDAVRQRKPVTPPAHQ